MADMKRRHGTFFVNVVGTAVTLLLSLAGLGLSYSVRLTSMTTPRFGNLVYSDASSADVFLPGVFILAFSAIAIVAGVSLVRVGIQVLPGGRS